MNVSEIVHSTWCKCALSKKPSLPSLPTYAKAFVSHQLLLSCTVSFVLSSMGIRIVPQEHVMGLAQICNHGPGWVFKLVGYI